MKQGRSNKKRIPWPLVLLIETAAMCLLGALSALSLYLGGAVKGAMEWGVMPVAGFIAAFIATRGGVNNYIAWLAPPIAMPIMHILLWGYVPEPGPILLCAFLSLIGAAAGDVLNRQKKHP